MKTDIESRRLLLVEDDPAMRDLMSEVLRDAGYAVDAAENGARALVEVFRDAGLDGYDLVLSDVRMPGMDGLELAWVLRDLDGPPIVLVSAFATPQLRQEARDAGVLALVSKPFDSERLVDLIRTLCAAPIDGAGLGPDAACSGIDTPMLHEPPR